MRARKGYGRIVVKLQSTVNHTPYHNFLHYFVLEANYWFHNNIGKQSYLSANDFLWLCDFISSEIPIVMNAWEWWPSWSQANPSNDNDGDNVSQLIRLTEMNIPWLSFSNLFNRVSDIICYFLLNFFFFFG